MNGNYGNNGNNGNVQGETSGLAHIPKEPDHPLELFKEWLKDARSSPDVLHPEALCLSTSTRDGQVSSRYVLLRRLDDDGFVVVTDRRSKKAREILNNSHCAMAFLWVYRQDGDKIVRQVRVEGTMVELEVPQYKDIYDKEPVYCRIRSQICHQGQPVDWHDLHQQHNQVLHEYSVGTNALDMPDYYVGYKLLPTMFDFYFAYDTNIGDRLSYLKTDQDSWSHQRIAA